MSDICSYYNRIGRCMRCYNRNNATFVASIQFGKPRASARKGMAESPVKHADAVIRVCFTGHISKGVWVSARIPPGGGFCVIKALHQVSTTNLRGDSMSHSTEVIPQTKPWYKKWLGYPHCHLYMAILFHLVRVE